MLQRNAANAGSESSSTEAPSSETPPADGDKKP